MNEHKAKISSYKDLTVWKKSIVLTLLVYGVTQKFPNEEKYGLSAQMRRATVSVPSNIAEGRSRRSRKDFIQFLYFSLGSLAELETQLEISERLRYVQKEDYNEISGLLVEIRMMLSKLVSSLKA